MLFRQELQFDKVGLKISSPNNQGLNFLLHVQFRQVLKNCVKASRARIPGKQAGIPGKQARIREERFYLLAIVWFLRTRLSRNGEAEMRNSESKQKRTNFPTGEDLGSGGISRVRQKNRSKPSRAQILACGGYRYINHSQIGGLWHCFIPITPFFLIQPPKKPPVPGTKAAQRVAEFQVRMSFPIPRNMPTVDTRNGQT